MRSMASGASARVRSTPWPRRVMRMRRSRGTSLASRGDGAVDLGDEQAHRVRPDVDRRDPAHRPPLARGLGKSATRAAPRSSGRPGRRRRRAGTRSGRAGTSPRCGCRRRRPTGAARCDPPGSRRRARRRTRGGRPATPRGRPRPARRGRHRRPRAARPAGSVPGRPASTASAWPAVAREGRVADDDRRAVGVAHDHVELGLRLPSEQRGERGDVVGSGHARSLRVAPTVPEGCCSRARSAARSTWWGRAGSRTDAPPA